MSNPVGAAGSMARRSLAVELLSDGNTLTEVADRLQVSLSSVKRWKKAFQQGGDAALAVQWSKGPTCRLTDAQRARLRQILIDGPCAAGFSTDLWTCPRVVEVIRREFGVSYHPDHMCKILHAMGFTPQKPQRRARERDEAAIEAWPKKDWPRIKKRGGDAKLPSFSSMKAALSCNL
jgi:transposase